MAWLPTPGIDQSAETPTPAPQGDMWGTIKNIMSGLPKDVGMQPFPMGYIPSAPSFISKLAQGFKDGKMLLPEEINKPSQYLTSGMSTLKDRRSPALIDQWGNSWASPESHNDTMLDLISSKNKRVVRPEIKKYLFDREYDPTPHGLGDYKFIRSAGNMGSVNGAEIPLNATEDSLEGLADLIKKGDTLVADYRIPVRGAENTFTGYFKNFINQKYPDMNFFNTFKKFNHKDLVSFTQDMNQKVSELYPEFQKWLAQRKSAEAENLRQWRSAP